MYIREIRSLLVGDAEPKASGARLSRTRLSRPGSKKGTSPDWSLAIIFGIDIDSQYAVADLRHRCSVGDAQIAGTDNRNVQRSS